MAPRLALVDDDKLLMRGFARYFGPTYEVESFLTAGDFTAALTSGRTFDLVLLDYWIPDMPGDQVVAFMEQHAPALIARCVLTTGAMADDLPQKLLARLNGRVLLKPYPPARAKQVLDALLHATTPTVH